MFALSSCMWPIKKERTVVQCMHEKREPLFMFACRPGRVRWRERESARQQAAARQPWLVARYCSAVAGGAVLQRRAVP
jgi:hypothetical protein